MKLKCGHQKTWCRYTSNKLYPTNLRCFQVTGQHISYVDADGRRRVRGYILYVPSVCVAYRMFYTAAATNDPFFHGRRHRRAHCMAAPIYRLSWNILSVAGTRRRWLASVVTNCDDRAVHFRSHRVASKVARAHGHTYTPVRLLGTSGKFRWHFHCDFHPKCNSGSLSNK